VLLVGNSQLGLNPPDVAEALEAMSLLAYDGAHTLIVDRFQEFGQACARFALDGGLAMVESGNYDVVLLLPAIGETRANEACWEQFRVAAEGSGARFGVMATAHVRSNFPAGFTTLHNDVGSYAADHDLLFVPAGDAWLRFLSANPAAPLKSLYASDSQHPGAEGDLLYVYTLYGALARVSTVGLPPDVLQLRCNMNQPCLSYDALDACVGDNGDFNCSGQNGALFGPPDGGARVAFVTADEALAYQQAADAALAAR
jgi:hypothetical protein